MIYDIYFHLFAVEREGKLWNIEKGVLAKWLASDVYPSGSWHWQLTLSETIQNLFIVLYSI